MAACHSCAAPLPEASATCSYCGSVNDIDLARLSEFTEQAPAFARRCPDCREPMAAVDIGNAQEARFLIERCDRCLGLFFDAGEIEALLEASVSHSYAVDFARLGRLDAPASPDIVQYRHCPDCGKLMNRVNYGARSGVIVDRCRAHGVWLQAGELHRLLDWRKAGGLLYHEQIRREKEREAREAEEERRARLEKLLREAAAYER